MKCPVCGQELRPGKKDPNYLLCYTCKKKYKVPKRTSPEKASSKKARTEETRYSNIPPEDVRETREKEMRKAYDDMLAAGSGKKTKRKTKPVTKPEETYEEDFYDDEEVSKAPIIILGIAIVVVAAVIVYMLLV